MLEPPRWPCAAVLAVGFGIGVGCVGLVPASFSSPIALAVALIATYLWRSETPTVAGGRLVLIFVMLGALRGAVAEQPVASISECALLSDDRQADEVLGPVTGPIEDGPGVRRFVMVAGSVRILVSARGVPLPALLPGDRVRVIGRLRSPRGYRVPGAASARGWLRSRGAHLTASVASSQVAVVARGSRLSLWRTPVRLQRAAASRIDARAGPNSGKAVVRAMALGDRGGLDLRTVAAFRGAGASHVLAVSGLHLAVVGMLLLLATRRLWALVPGLWIVVSPHRAAATGAALGSALFALVTGGRVSTLRALVVALLVLFALASARRLRLIDGLGVAALVLLAVTPSSLFDPSFQLSFAATTTLVLVFGGRPTRRGSRWQRVLRYPLELARASAWAVLATAPFVALSFGSFAPAGLVANVIIVPLAELIVLPLALLGVLLQVVWPDGGGALLDVAVIAAELVTWIASRFSEWLPQWHVPAPRWWELFAMVGVWAAAVCWRRRTLSRRTCLALAAAGVVIVASSWFVTAHVQPRSRDHLRVVFLDVGQGDGAVVELPGGATWLVDAGGRPFVMPRPGESAATRRQRAAAPGRLSVLRYLQHRRVRRLDLVVVSHPHPDHYMGLFALAAVVPITELWVAKPPPGDDDSGTYAELIRLLRRAGTRIVHPAAGLARTTAGVRVRVLHPMFETGIASADPRLDANDNSLAISLEFANRRVLFAGDVEAEAERQLVARYGGGLRADIVKVPHHGSPTSSSVAFVDNVAPEYAIISCGLANRFGFPSPDVVARWRTGGASVLRTDRAGAVTVDISPSGALHVSTFDPVTRCSSAGRGQRGYKSRNAK